MSFVKKYAGRVLIFLAVAIISPHFIHATQYHDGHSCRKDSSCFSGCCAANLCSPKRNCNIIVDLQH